MRRTVTWLHLSDLHTCKPKTGWDARRVLKTLVPDLKQMETNLGEPPQLLFFTGDLAYGQLGTGPDWNIADQFKQAAEFLERVRTAFTREIPKENVFIVPGNHNVNRVPATEDQTEWLDSRKNVDPIQDLVRKGNADPMWRAHHGASASTGDSSVATATHTSSLTLSASFTPISAS